MANKMIQFSSESTTKAFSNHGYDYAEFAQLMKNTARGVDYGVDADGNPISKADANNKIREVMFSVLGVSPDCTRKELRKAIRKHKIDLFEVIEETVDDLLTSGWQENEFFMRFVETRNLALGDTNEFYSREDIILNVHRVSGGHHDLIRQRLNEGSVYHIPVQKYGIKIYTEAETFMMGRIDCAAFIEKIYEALDYKVNELTYEAFMSMGDEVTPSEQFVITGTLDDTTKSQFLELITDVQAANRGSRIAIVGTKVALSYLYAISDPDWIAETSKEERRTLGRLAIWEGVDIIELPQVYAANTTTKIVDDTKLLIIPDVDWRPIKLVYEGDAEIVENTVDDGNHMDSTFDYEYQTKFGVGVIVNRKFGVWNITT